MGASGGRAGAVAGSPWTAHMLGAAAAAAGGVHLALAEPHFGEARWLGFAFLLSGVVLVHGGLLLLSSATRWAWAIAGTASASTAWAYLASRLVGLPGTHREPWDALGVATTAVEAAVAVAAVAALAPRVRRRHVAVPLATLFAVPAIAASAITPAGAPAGCVVATKHLTLYAQELGNGPDGAPLIGYGLSPTTASIPGPLIEMVEGDCMSVTLVNNVSAATLQRLRDDGRWPSDPNLPLGLSLHAHGVRYTHSSDGTAHTGSFARPGGAYTYLWYAAPRVAAHGQVTAPGSAGYWWYHDHVVGTDHGTGGLAAGLWGGLVVRRASDPRPDRTFVVGMGGPRSEINFHSYPRSFNCDANGDVPGPDCFVAEQGSRVEFVVVGVPGTRSDEDMHEFHLHAHTWADNRTGLLSSIDDDVRVIDAKTIGPSETFGFQVVAGQEGGAGDWMLHCHIQEHSDRGMATFFRVVPRASSIPRPPPTPQPGATH